MFFIKKYSLVWLTICSIGIQYYFSKSISIVSNQFPYEFIPAKWFFYFWGFIYFKLLFESIVSSRVEYGIYKNKLLFINVLLVIWVFLWINQLFFLSSLSLLLLIMTTDIHYVKKSNIIFKAWFMSAFIQNILIALSNSFNLTFNKDITISLFLLLIFQIKDRNFYYYLTILYVILGIVLN